MIELAVETDSLRRVRARWNDAPVIVREELQSGTVQATNETRDALKASTPVGPGQGAHTRDAIVSRFEQVGAAEFRGTVTLLGGRANQIMRWLDAGTRAHEIRPRFKKALRFTVAGATYFRMSVHHPGTRALHLLSRTREEMAPRVRRIFSARLANITKRLKQ